MQLFYPSHDIALANGLRHFNPPAMALHLQEDLAYLSDVWNQSFLRGETSIPIPWGWDYDTRAHIHQKYGIRLNQLPTDDDLLALRQLSSRQTTVRICHELAEALPSLRFTQPRFIGSDEALFDYIREHDKTGRPYVLKTLWSSSGRGLITSHQQAKDGKLYPRGSQAIMSQTRNAIRKMGGIMAEEWIEDKLQDFAMLFRAGDDGVKFIGYSLFDNDEALGGTTYRCGYLLSNDEIETRLAVPATTLHDIAHQLELTLTSLLEPFIGRCWPLGYVGIDMLSSRQGIHPCIEMNLRCTMGTVCRLWHDQHGRDGIFRISPMRADGHFEAQFITD